MNVILTCAGRRRYLVNWFADAIKGKGRVLAVDLRIDAPALQSADIALTVPPVKSPDYINTLLSICREYKVGLLVPLNDLELPLLASNQSKFNEYGTKVVISSPDVIDICFDKWKTFCFLKKRGLGTPATFKNISDATIAIEQGKLNFPVIVKPRWGSASIGIERAYSFEELRWIYLLVQRRIEDSQISGIGIDNEPIVAIVNINLIHWPSKSDPLALA